MQNKVKEDFASVNFYGEKTNVTMGEDIMLKFFVVNLINNTIMHAQVIIIPPSGMSVNFSEFSEFGAGQYDAKFALDPGQGRDIEVKIKANQIGDLDIQARVVHYFGENKIDVHDSLLNLPIHISDNTTESLHLIPNFGIADLFHHPLFSIACGIIAIVIGGFIRLKIQK